MDYDGESDPVPVSIAIGDFSGHCFCMPSRAASPVDKAIFYYFQGSYEHFSLNSVFHIPFDTIVTFIFISVFSIMFSKRFRDYTNHQESYCI